VYDSREVICETSKYALARKKPLVDTAGDRGVKDRFLCQIQFETHIFSASLRFSWIWPLCACVGVAPGEIHRVPKISKIRVHPVFRGRNALSLYARCIMKVLYISNDRGEFQHENIIFRITIIRYCCVRGKFFFSGVIIRYVQV